MSLKKRVVRVGAAQSSCLPSFLSTPFPVFKGVKKKDIVGNEESDDETMEGFHIMKWPPPPPFWATRLSTRNKTTSHIKKNLDFFSHPS